MHQDGTHGVCEREGENQTHDSLFLTDSAPSLSLSLPCCLSLVAVTVDVVAVVVVTQKHTQTHSHLHQFLDLSILDSECSAAP